uniref:FACT complex subunit n=1 Tax=Panagrolaimus sp. JU765 TaxID=591449 RepID=A0AC34RE49_9BILA
MEFQLADVSTFHFSQFLKSALVFSKKIKVKFTPEDYAKVAVLIYKRPDDLVDVFFVVTSMVDVAYECTVAIDGLQKTGKNDVREKKCCKEFKKWGKICDLFKLEKLTVEWSAILKPKIVIPAQ